MKSFRYLFILLLLCVFLTLFVSCRGSGTDPEGITTVQFYLVNMGQPPRGTPEVQEAINRIMEPQGVRINLTVLDGSSMTAQVPIAMAAGEAVDLMHPSGGGTSFLNMLASNNLTDLTDILPVHGPRIISTIDDIIPGLIGGTTINGRIMAIPNMFNKVSNFYFNVREDLLLRHNLGSMQALNSLADVERMLTVLRNADPTISPIVGEASGAILMNINDVHDFDNPTIALVIDSIGHVYLHDPYTVFNLFASDHFRRNLDTVRRWYQNGLVYRDAAINEERPEELVRANRGFSWFGNSETGVEVAKSAQTGHPITVRKIYSLPITTTIARHFSYMIPAVSRVPEASVKFLDNVFTDPRLTTLLVWGIEGRDHIVLPDGTVDFPPGVTVQTVAYRSTDFLSGNQFITPPWTGNPPDLRQQALVENRTTQLSPIFGFAFDASEFRAEIAAITATIDQYGPGLLSGTVDPAVNLPIFLDALNRAGAERLIAEQQRQLDAWWAQRGR